MASTGWHPYNLDDQLATPAPNELLMGIITQVVLDLDEILLLEKQKPDRQRVTECLQDYWGAKNYLASKNFETHCDIIGLDAETVRNRLASKIAAGRKVYGKLVRTLPSINLPVDEGVEDVTE